MTYAQRSLEVRNGIRAARRAERALDTQLERVERELQRLLKRKTLIQEKSVQTLIRLWDQGVRPSFAKCQQAMADAVGRASI
jgi:hypothetical protein